MWASYRAKITVLSILIAGSLGGAAWVWLAAPPSELIVTALDVGQGDSTLIETPYGQNIVIDGGDGASIANALSEQLPFYDRTIDVMILTHPDADHITGLITVFARYTVTHVLYTGVAHDTSEYAAWQTALAAEGAAATIIDRPQTVTLGDGLTLNILAPQHSVTGKSVANLNDTSIVAKLIYGDTAMLLTGDAEAELEAALIASGADLHADVLKVGHHGSDTSTTQAFVDAVDPDYAIISAGEDNRFGHPSLRILKRLERAGAQIYQTDEDGWVQVVSDEKNIAIRAEK